MAITKEPPKEEATIIIFNLLSCDYYTLTFSIIEFCLII